jgi:hypothetical protein
MAYLLADTFDFYGSYADLALRWIIGPYVPAFVPAANTAFGTGQALQANDINGLALSMQGNFVTTGTLGGNEPTIYLSFRLKALPGIGIGQQFQVLLTSNSSPQIAIQFTGDGSIVIRNGGTGGFPLAPAQPAAFVINTWDSWQVKVFISQAAGTVEVRKNGSTTPLFVLTNVNTQASSTASANGLQLYNNTSGTSTPFWALDDLYVNSANDAAPTSWPGDVRGTVVMPNGAVTTGFTAFPAALIAHRYWRINITTVSNGNNVNLAELQMASSVGGANLFGSGTAFASAAQGSSYPASAACDGNLTSFWSTPDTGSSTSLPQWWAYDFGAGHSLIVTEVRIYPLNVSGSPYAPTAFTLDYSDDSSIWTTVQAFTTAGWSISTWQTFDVTGYGLSNYAAVNNPTENGGATYVQASVIGTEDLYSVSPTSAQNVIGVNVFAYLKRSDSGSKTAGIQVKLSGGTDTTELTINPSLSYAWQTAYLAVDPTGAPWTPTTVTTMNLGIKVIT